MIYTETIVGFTKKNY